MPEKKLTTKTYLEAMHRYGIKIQGGTIHQFINMSKVKHFNGGRCPIYQIEMNVDGLRVVVGGNFATNGRPTLSLYESLDFAKKNRKE